MRERLARMDEDQLLLLRIAPEEVEERHLLAAHTDPAPLFSERLQRPIARVPCGELRNRRGGGPWRGAGSAKEMTQREPLAFAVVSCRQPARGSGKCGIAFRLARC